MKFKVIIPIILFVFCICLITILVSFRGSPRIPKAIIVDNLRLDKLSPSGKNIPFVNETRKLLKGVGVEVEYVGVENVTLEVYQNLAQYNFVILRVHSGMLVEGGKKIICFFSSEELSERNLQKYGQWFDKNYLANATLELPNGIKKSFIGVRPNFIRNCLNGRFQDSIIIAMGCNSSFNDSMARAFVNDRNALAYIGWTSDVTVNHTDSATLGLLKSFFEKNETIREAINKAPADRRTGARLTYYPDDKTTGNLRPKEIIEQLLEKKSSFISDLIDSFSWVLLITLSASNWLSSCYRKFLRKF